ncbi:uncharacterized protein LOC130824040 [Amaranthus tricolor]|uniref:uncharacterized protein LOC130824040 n=1 Tax=Amaranthus tricolor TaxID=29722 RepID=UPI00258F1DD5|nr:uncharacterized protein LOC130824040 [Amaranthus tricolor]
MKMQKYLRTFRITTHFHRRLHHTSAMATPSPSSSFLSSFIKNSNPNIRKSLNINRTFKFYPIRSNNSNQSSIDIKSPQQQRQGEESFLLSISSKRSVAVATGELFIGIASRFINFQRNKRNLVMDEESTVLTGDFSEESENGERIASVMEDPLQPEVVWEQREKDVEEEQRRMEVTSPGFSFSAAGLLFPYHLGVAQFLIENGYIKDTTPLAGSSAGAIVCAVIASGSTMQDALQATKILAEDCRTGGTAFRLGAVLRDILQKVLPEDAHTRCNGRIRVAVTQIGWRPKGLLIDQFDSREDLINALFTSSFIPGYLAPRPATMFRKRLCIDGGLTLFMPPTSASQTVRVCAFPASTLRMQGIGISPDCNPETRLSTRQLFNWALEPADDFVLDKLFEFGYSDAATWAQDNPVSLIVHEEKPQPQGLV